MKQICWSLYLTLSWEPTAIKICNKISTWCLVVGPEGAESSVHEVKWKCDESTRESISSGCSSSSLWCLGHISKNVCGVVWVCICMPEMNEWVPSSSFQHIKPFCCNTYIYSVCLKKSCIKRLALQSKCPILEKGRDVKFLQMYELFLRSLL